MILRPNGLYIVAILAIFEMHNVRVTQVISSSLYQSITPFSWIRSSGFCELNAFTVAALE